MNQPTRLDVDTISFCRIPGTGPYVVSASHLFPDDGPFFLTRDEALALRDWLSAVLEQADEKLATGSRENDSHD